MIHPNANDTLTVRSVFIIGARQEGEAHHHLPGERPGRNFDEILRVIDSLQLTAELQRGHAGELEGRRGRHHRRPPSPTRTPRRSSRRAGRRSSPTCGSRPSPTSNAPTDCTGARSSGASSTLRSRLQEAADPDQRAEHADRDADHEHDDARIERVGRPEVEGREEVLAPRDDGRRATIRAGRRRRTRARRRSRPARGPRP